MDHCFLRIAGSEESVDGNPCLLLYDNETEAMLTIAGASKSTKAWVVESVKQVLSEVGCGELKVAIKCDGAR